jgi:hypothetical protein
MPKVEEWKEAVSLREMLYQMFDKQKTESKEFKALLAGYGRPRVTAIWEDWKKEKELEKKKPASSK